MQILFVHPNFPAQFGHIASRLVQRPDVDCVFVSRAATGTRDGIRCVQYTTRGGATRSNHYCSRTFENAVWSAHGVYEACRSAPDLKPDLIVGHSGFGTTVFLRELYDAPIVNYFEYYYHPRGTDRKNLVPLREMDEAETTKILAEIGLIEAQENRRMSQLDLARARAALALRTIHSPITGVVIERSLATGEFAKQAPIVRIAQIDPLRVEVIVPVSLLNKITVGMRADVLPEVGGAHTGRVTVVDRVVDAASGTFGVRLALPNADYRLPAGLKCKVRFPTR
ncbi:MAG: efflux RND transporter periplasmic adaptor subunit [Candidatus Rokuibacteriota bacterium]